MALYEHVFLARQDLAQAQVDALAETATKIIEENQGKVVKTETWGLRSLAYRIAKNRKAHYVMLEIDAPGTGVAELERQTAINEDVIRYMTVRVDEHEQGPSVMMRKGDRGDRRGGGGRGRDRDDRGDRGGRDNRDSNDDNCGGAPWHDRFSAAARAAPSPRRTRPGSTIRTSGCSRDSSRSVARSFPRASPR